MPIDASAAKPSGRGAALRWALVALVALVVLLPVAFVIGVRTGAIGPTPVPADVVDRSVLRGDPELGAALALPSARPYLPLHSQRNGSTCGPASLVNVQHALGRGVADEYALLSGSDACTFGVCIPGLTLDELAELARQVTGREVTVVRDLSLDAFRTHLREANDPRVHYVVNFDRAGVFGQGGGHHSPIGAYLPDQDRVLVMDVNAHYGPWLVPTESLYAAIDTLDSAAGAKRGLLRIE